MCHVVDDRSGSGSVLAPGSLLVAAPGLLDPNFHRTVVYLIEHRDGGSLGVVLNRPSEVSVRDVLPSWAPLSSQPPSVFVGGPVESRDRAVPGRGAHRARPGRGGRPGPGARAGGAGRPRLGPERRWPTLLRGLRVFAGYAGWDPGQLDGEIARGDWIVVPALPDDVLTRQDAGLWGHVLRRQGMPLALLATYPADVRQN